MRRRLSPGFICGLEVQHYRFSETERMQDCAIWNVLPAASTVWVLSLNFSTWPGERVGTARRKLIVAGILLSPNQKGAIR